MSRPPFDQMTDREIRQLREYTRSSLRRIIANETSKLESEVENEFPDSRGQ